MKATQQQIDTVISWGFTKITDTTYLRNILEGVYEYWTANNPEIIDFADKDGNHTETYKIDWKLFTK
jgi:hypothetical protein